MSTVADDVAAASWYHTLELPGGIVTPGEYDLRPALAKVPLPARLDGLRCLDVGVRDGFWAFEMERRGAREVVGIDLLDPRRLDWPYPKPDLPPSIEAELERRNAAFEVAKRALDSGVERRIVSVYDLDPERDGTFDFAVLGTLLLHLRDPVEALASVARVLRGPLLLNEVVSLTLTALRPRTPAAVLMTLPDPYWWIPNSQALRRYLVAAGYAVEAHSRPYLLANGPRLRSVKGRRGLPRPGNLRRALALALGAPHVWLWARPQGVPVAAGPPRPAG